MPSSSRPVSSRGTAEIRSKRSPGRSSSSPGTLEMSSRIARLPGGMPAEIPGWVPRGAKSRSVKAKPAGFSRRMTRPTIDFSSTFISSRTLSGARKTYVGRPVRGSIRSSRPTRLYAGMGRGEIGTATVPSVREARGGSAKGPQPSPQARPSRTTRASAANGAREARRAPRRRRRGGVRLIEVASSLEELATCEGFGRQDATERAQLPRSGEAPAQPERARMGACARRRGERGQRAQGLLLREAARDVRAVEVRHVDGFEEPGDGPPTEERGRLEGKFQRRPTRPPRSTGKVSRPAASSIASSTGTQRMAAPSSTGMRTWKPVGLAGFASV